jgi:hypothetical protein
MVQKKRQAKLIVSQEEGERIANVSHCFVHLYGRFEIANMDAADPRVSPPLRSILLILVPTGLT